MQLRLFRYFVKTIQTIYVLISVLFSYVLSPTTLAQPALSQSPPTSFSPCVFLFITSYHRLPPPTFSAIFFYTVFFFVCVLMRYLKRPSNPNGVPMNVTLVENRVIHIMRYQHRRQIPVVAIISCYCR